MTKAEIFDFVKSEFNVYPEYLWEKFPNYAILRKAKNKKWFGAVVEIPQSKLGLEGDILVDVINLKVPKDFMPLLQGNAGIYPAWHMHKKTWVSVLLKEADTALVKDLLKQSYEIC